jgi:GDPmannose 4,6-dehydratase
MTHVALITGISGQDGSYLSELLLEKNYYVWGIIRKSSTMNFPNLLHVINNKRLILKYGDVLDMCAISHILNDIKESYVDLERLEIYNLGALSHVKVSFDIPEYCANVNALGPIRILEAIRLSGYKNKIRYYQASTSEMYGTALEIPQTENTPFNPQSPYAISKLAGYWFTKNYREAYNIYTANGILFNHESPRRDKTFVTRKITCGINDILKGNIKFISLGNLNACRDWGHAKDYVLGIWAMLQQESGDDYILSTGETHTVREFVEKAFLCKGINIAWKGESVNEIGINKDTGETLIMIDSNLFRPTEVDILLGDSSKAKEKLQWKILYSFDELVKDMVNADCD